ncbi:hypothetical protein [Mesorhizobium sp. LNHC229A00]|uniref:hypothetical protein n=1 Tax=Mesorhizobium sp. LNHC229A00 TaxID=1287240 RepID=UPI0003CE9792|nr:hypothetical protein [Mesorhizobium sp. LNHC229A00]ESY92320.1 hypothetical protein X741_21695 [Mesorhizobium sp. LNHC229A00]
MGTRGPTPKPAAERKSAPLSLRLRPYLKEALEAEALENRRPLSEEITFRLQQTLSEDKYIERRFGSAKTYRLLQAIGLGIEQAASKMPETDWLNDRDAFNFVVSTVDKILDAIRPGSIRVPNSEGHTGSVPEFDFHVSTAIATNTWKEIVQSTGPSDRFHNINSQLGAIIGRPNVYRDEYYERLQRRYDELPATHQLKLGDLGHAEQYRRLSKAVEAEMIAEGKDPRLNEDGQ